MNTAKKQDNFEENNFEIKVDARESIRLPVEVREKYGISKDTILILHASHDGKLFFEKKDEEKERRKKQQKKKEFMEYFSSINLTKKEDITVEEFLNDSRRY